MSERYTMETSMVTRAIPIRNRSKIDQFIIVDGERHLIPAFHTKVVSPQLADAFTRQCAPHVVREEGGLDVIDDARPMRGTTYVWLMNATGDPDSPEELKFRKHTKEGVVEESIKNPKHEPIVVRQRMQGGQVPARVKGEDTVLNLGTVDITVWPFSRKAFDKDTAEWLLRRDASQTESMRGCLKPAREPSGDEPNDTWELQDLQLYAMMLGIEKYGKTMSTLKKDASRLGKSVEALTDETKTELLKRLFFRIADKEHPLPTQEQWEAYRAKQHAAPSRDKVGRVMGEASAS